jgi:histone H3/H4
MNPDDRDQQSDSIERHGDIEEVHRGNEPQVERKKEDRVQRNREAGKSLLPIARVQKIVKADKARWHARWTIIRNWRAVQDIPIVSKEAIFVISLATEEFIKRLSEASQRVASREKRLTVLQRDIGVDYCRY